MAVRLRGCQMKANNGNEFPPWTIFTFMQLSFKAKNICMYMCVYVGESCINFYQLIKRSETSEQNRMAIKISQRGQIQLNGDRKPKTGDGLDWFPIALARDVLLPKSGCKCKQMKIKRWAMKIKSNGHLATCPTCRGDSKKIKLSKKLLRTAPASLALCLLKVFSFPFCQRILYGVPTFSCLGAFYGNSLPFGRRKIEARWQTCSN